eukprot:11857291-Alexandrium_andersonii.AAC.1
MTMQPTAQQPVRESHFVSSECMIKRTAHVCERPIALPSRFRESLPSTSEECSPSHRSVLVLVCMR